MAVFVHVPAFRRERPETATGVSPVAGPWEILAGVPAGGWQAWHDLFRKALQAGIFTCGILVQRVRLDSFLAGVLAVSFDQDEHLNRRQGAEIGAPMTVTTATKTNDRKKKHFFSGVHGSAGQQSWFVRGRSPSPVSTRSPPLFSLVAPCPIVSSVGFAPLPPSRLRRNGCCWWWWCA